MHVVRALLLVAVGLVVSGVPQFLAAALDDECCAEACDGSLDGKHCPPNCENAACAKLQASLAAADASLDGPAVNVSRSVVVAQAAPRLPPFTAGVFHPPRA